LSLFSKVSHSTLILPQVLSSNHKGSHAKALTVNALKILHHTMLPGENVQETYDRYLSFLTLSMTTLNTFWRLQYTGWEDLCILLVLTLLQLQFSLYISKKDPKTDEPTPGVDQMAAYLIQALCVLRRGREKSPNDYRLALLSVRLAQSMGLTSIALRELNDLKLKEVQLDSLGHLVLTRIATLHPFRAADKVGRSMNDQNADPLARMRRALDWYPHALNQVTDFLSGDLEFDKLPEFAEFRDKIDTSFTRTLLQIESRRVSRMTDMPLNGTLPSSLFIGKISDNRDFSTFPNFDTDGPEQVQEMLFFDSIPYESWLLRAAWNDYIQTMLDPKQNPESQIRGLRVVFNRIQHLPLETESPSCTESERRSWAVWNILMLLVCRLFIGENCELASKNLKEHFEQLVSSLQDYKMEPRDWDPLPHHSYLHDRFTLLEILKTCTKLADSALAFSKQRNHHAAKVIPVQVVQKLKRVVGERADAIHKEARTMKAAITVEAIKTLAKRGATGELVVKMTGEQFIVRTAKVIVESAHDALDGLLKVKV
jgi:N-terminal acetyltransferase B complex non-catalytic subunit